MEKGSIKKKKMAIDRKLSLGTQQSRVLYSQRTFKMVPASPRLSVEEGGLCKSKFNMNQDGYDLLAILVHGESRPLLD